MPTATRGAARAVDPPAASATTLQQRARALGNPTRFAIFRAIAETDQPQTIAQLRTRFHLNHTTIRQHLAILVEAGLLTEGVAPPSGPGRPRLHYREAPGVAGTWTPDGPYEMLSLLLLEALRSGRLPHDVGYDQGRAAAQELDGNADPLDAVEAGVARQGFEPRRVGGDGAELSLDRCPFARVAEVDPGTVCALHRGLAEGLADGIGGVSVIDLVARPPQRAGCRLRLATADATPGGPNVSAPRSSGPTSAGSKPATGKRSRR